MTEPTHEEMIEIATQREAENVLIAKVSEDDYHKVLDAMDQSFGQQPWDESDLDYVAPNGDYIKSYPLINRVEVIGKNGREFVQYDCSHVQVSIQDDGRTLKVFLS